MCFNSCTQLMEKKLVICTLKREEYTANVKEIYICNSKYFFIAGNHELLEMCMICCEFFFSKMEEIILMPNRNLC